MRFKKKKIIFLCRLQEEGAEALKYTPAPEGIGKIDGPQGAPSLLEALKKLGYKDQTVIVSLPRDQATCRYLKIPSAKTKEIEKILLLQAPLYLPYQPEELVIGYQILSTDKEGYSDINLTVAHKGAVERYLRELKSLNPEKICLVLSSYALAGLYNYIGPPQSGIIMFLDIRDREAEAAVIFKEKLIFSRAFKIDTRQPEWINTFTQEIIKTTGLYAKDFSQYGLDKIVLLDRGGDISAVTGSLNKGLGLPVETVSSRKKINIKEDSAVLAGLGMEDIPPTLNMLPQELKEALSKAFRLRDRIQSAALCFAIILMLVLGLMKNLNNKTHTLEKINTELAAISNQAKPLEETMKRIRAIRQRGQKGIFSLDIIYELHKAIPPQISLVNLTYEDTGKVILQGQATELEAVFGVVSKLEISEVFKDFDVKVKYATKKRTPEGEITDFEILCLKK